MGGGAAMRTAAKVAGASILNNGLRGVALPDNTFSSAARKAARPVGGVFASSSSSESGKSAAAVGVDQEAVQTQTPFFDFADWEFAGGEEDLLAVAGDGGMMPRLVFGGAPSIEEAKEATSELKDVLEKAYLSSSPSSPISRRSQSDVLETKPCLTSEAIVARAPPQHAMKAFKYLSESPEAQTVVASIASDPNVWKAVLHNPALQEYLQTQNISKNNAVNVELYEKASSTGSSNGSPQNIDGSFGMDDIVDYLQSLKHLVVDMVSNLGDYFQNLFGVSNGEKDAKENPLSGFLDKALGPSLFGLAVMVIMVVVLKRA